jgi:hypothetical protein
MVLVNAVLSSLFVYFMSSILLPKSVRELLDARRRAFLWTGEKNAMALNALWRGNTCAKAKRKEV